MSFGSHDAELAHLGNMLHQAATYARTVIDAIPLDASPDDEGAAIDSASAPAVAIAERIMILPAECERDAAVHAKASAWLDGTYWREAA